MSGWGAIYNNVTYALSLQGQQMARLQEQASTGSRVNRASDDPAAAYAILRLGEQQDRATAYIKNVDAVTTTLETCDTALQNTSDALLQVQQLLSQVSSGTYTDDQRGAMAEQVNGLLEQVLSLANTQGASGYVFGGGQTSRPPYEAQRDARGQIVAVDYQGSFAATSVPVAGGVRQYGQMVGDDIFRANRREAPRFLGATGAQASAATSSVRGDVWLTIAHAATTFEAGSQLAAGTSSAAGDTIIGAHKVTLSAAGRTVQLDDGPAVSFSGSETNLRLQNASGDVAYLNMTGWTTADGQFDVQAGGTLSLDGGTTSTPLTQSDHASVTDPRTGQVLYVDATGITRTGLEPVIVPGTHDLFTSLIHIRDTLANTQGLSSSQQIQLLGEASDSVKEVRAQVTRGDTAVGGRLKVLDNMKNLLSDTGALSKQQADSLQNADITQVSVDLARAQNLYQMTLASAARLLNISILDYIQ